MAGTINDTIRTATIVDGHVHIYDCFSVPDLLDAAWRNISSLAGAQGLRSFSGVLLLAETAREHVFARLKQEQRAGRWSIRPTMESDLALVANGPAGSLLLVAGRQLETAEGLEVLALVTPETFPDGWSIQHAVESVERSGAVPVIPWGAGKWLGRRGAVLREVVNTRADLFLGDNGGRPWFWPGPAWQFAGRPLLSGTDPLPIPGEEKRVGSAGFILEVALGSEKPASQLRNLLSSGNSMPISYGNPIGLSAFIRNQMRLRSNPGKRERSPGTIGSSDQ
jgi:hypothetical protein